MKSDSSVTDWAGGGSVPAGLSNITALAAAKTHCLTLRKDGTAVAWGTNTYGQLNVADWTNLIGVAAVPDLSIGLRSNGTVAVHGLSGQDSPPAGLSNVVSISAQGWNWYGDVGGGSGGGSPRGFNLALKSDGTVVGWGWATAIPADLTGAVAVAAGRAHGLALRSDGTVLGWGDNTYGQSTGVPSTGYPPRATGQVMVAAEVLSNVIAIAAGANHSLALKNDGTVVAWADNYYGQTSVPAEVSNVVAIAAGDNQSLAIRSDLKVGSIALGSQGPVIRFHTFAGQNYLVEYSRDLSPTNWEPLASGSVSGNGRDAAMTDSDPSVTGARFYRVRQLP